MSEQGRTEEWGPTGQELHLARAYDLVFASTVPIPEMWPVDAGSVLSRHADVTVRVGETPRVLNDPVLDRTGYQATPDEFLMEIDDLARYHVVGGESVVIEPVEGADPHELRVYLLGTCLGVILHQRGFLVLHASGVLGPHGAALFCGPSGAGKSTVLGELLRRGYPMLVDDVCAVRVQADVPPTVVPSYPRTRVWSDTAARLEIDTSGMPRTRKDMDKFERQVWEQFSAAEAPLHRLYHLAGTSPDQVLLERATGFEAFGTVTSNTYRRALLEGLSRRGSHFDLAAQVARAVDVVHVIRPRERFAVEELADAIEADLIA